MQSNKPRKQTSQTSRQERRWGQRQQHLHNQWTNNQANRQKNNMEGRWGQQRQDRHNYIGCFLSKDWQHHVLKPQKWRTLPFCTRSFRVLLMFSCDEAPHRQPARKRWFNRLRSSVKAPTIGTTNFWDTSLIHRNIFLALTLLSGIAHTQIDR